MPSSVCPRHCCRCLCWLSSPRLLQLRPCPWACWPQPSDTLFSSHSMPHGWNRVAASVILGFRTLVGCTSRPFCAGLPPTCTELEQPRPHRRRMLQACRIRGQIVHQKHQISNEPVCLRSCIFQMVKGCKALQLLSSGCPRRFWFILVHILVRHRSGIFPSETSAPPPHKS